MLDSFAPWVVRFLWCGKGTWGSVPALSDNREVTGEREEIFRQEETGWVLKENIRMSALLSLSCYFLSSRELARVTCFLHCVLKRSKTLCRHWGLDNLLGWTHLDFHGPFPYLSQSRPTPRTFGYNSGVTGGCEFVCIIHRACPCPPIHMLTPNPQCNGVRRWGL